MTTERAIEFHQTVAKNETLRESIRTAAPSERQQIIADAGFGDVSKADIESTRELSDDELMGAAGAGAGDTIVQGAGDAMAGMQNATDQVVGATQTAVDEVSSWFDW